jgi:threonine/homoserine/homoserine lactone efflux protein
LFNQIQSDQRFFWFGGIILIVFGIYTIYKKKKVAGIENSELKVPENNKYLQLFLKGFFLNFINVGVLAFWFAVVIAVSSNFQLNERKIIQHFAIVMVTIFLVDLVKIVVAKQLKSRLTPAVLNKIQITLGVFFIIFGLGLIVKQFVAI